MHFFSLPVRLLTWLLFLMLFIPLVGCKELKNEANESVKPASDQQAQSSAPDASPVKKSDKPDAVDLKGMKDLLGLYVFEGLTPHPLENFEDHHPLLVFARDTLYKDRGFEEKNCPNMQTQAEIETCAYDRHNAMKNQMLEAVDKLLVDYAKTERLDELKALVEAQAAWGHYVEYHCKSQSIDAINRRTYLGLHHSCMAGETVKRIVALQVYFEFP